MPLPTLCIAEYESFGVDEIKAALESTAKSAQTDSDKAQQKAAKIFSDLESFAKIKDNECFLGFNGRKLRAKNYVGLIQTKSGFCLEILPKTFKGSGFKGFHEENNKEKDNKERDNQADIKECTCGAKISPTKFNKDTFKKQMEGFVDCAIPCHSECSEESAGNGKKDVLQVWITPAASSPAAQHDREINALSQHDKGADTSDNNNPCPLCRVNQAKQILFNCLKTLKNSPFKKSNIATLQAQNLPLIEAFAAMFLDECESLAQRGLKSDYRAISQNRAFLKGKLEFSAHMRHNLAHKERFFTTSDEYTANIAPNRLIKSTLLLLSNLNLSSKTRARLDCMRFIFADVSSSQNSESDFAQCANMSRFKEYENLLLWCKLFLQNKAFSPYSGADRAFALLYPMEKLFESFVAHWLKVSSGDLSVKTQESGKYFMRDSKSEVGGDLFCLRPDIVLRRGSKASKSHQIIIADTKWKLLDSDDVKHGISQSDLYQMWAYVSKYALELNFSESSDISVWLIYPRCEGVSDMDNLTLSFKASEIFSRHQKASREDTNPYITLYILLFPLHSISKHHRSKICKDNVRSFEIKSKCVWAQIATKM